MKKSKTNLFYFIVIILLTSLFSQTAKSADIVIDINNINQPVLGFGAQTWPGDTRLESIITNLGLKFIRVCCNHSKTASVPTNGTREEYDNYWTTTDLGDIKKTWEITDRNNVEVVLNNFKIPDVWLGGDRKLLPQYNISFARFYAALIVYLTNNNMRPLYYELFNEPDGTWNDSCSAENYNSVVKIVRNEFDDRGLTDVKIVGPGLAHIDLEVNDQWIENLDSNGVAAISCWSIHGWEWRDKNNPQHVRDSWHYFDDAIKAKDPKSKKPIFITEYATYADTFNGVLTNSDSVPWAVRVYENTLSFLNCGANALIYWQSADVYWDPSNLFGFIRTDLSERPLYNAMRTLYPKIPVGANVINFESGNQGGSNDIYSAAFIKDNKFVIAMANNTATTRTKTVLIARAKEATFIEAKAFIDGKITNKIITIFPENLGTYTFDAELPRNSTLTIVCNVKPFSIINPGFEIQDGFNSYNALGWNGETGIDDGRSSEKSHTGNYSAKMKDVPQYHNFGQSIIGDFQGENIEVSVFGFTPGSDPLQTWANLKVEFKNAGGTTLDFVETYFMGKDSISDVWHEGSLQYENVPTGTTEISIFLMYGGDSTHAGTVYFDDVTFSVIPEPCSLLFIIYYLLIIFRKLIS